VAAVHGGGDLDGLLALTADQAVFLAPGSGPMTKSDFAAGFRGISEKVRIEPKQEVKDVGISGDLAYAWSRFTIVHTAKADGARSEARPVGLNVGPMASGARGLQDAKAHAQAQRPLVSRGVPA
jgi:ketosteroid isomerase-like protein